MPNEPKFENLSAIIKERNNRLYSENAIDTNVNQVWEEKLKNLKLYHGSSESTIDYLKKNGVSPNVKPYDISDLKTLDYISSKLGIWNTGYSKNKENEFYVSSYINNACLYAMNGPEILKLHFLPNINLILKGVESQRLNNVLTSDELTFLIKTKQKTIDALNSHKPALLEIDINAPSVKNYLEKKLRAEGRMIYSPDALKQEVMRYRSELPNFGIKEEIESLAQSIIRDLNNQAISTSIPANELGRVIKGEEFYSLPIPEYTGKVFKNIFFDMEKHPPELLNIMSGTNPPTEISKIKSIAKSYGFTDSEINILEERIKNFRSKVQ